MDTTSLVNDQVEAGARFLSRFDKIVPVAVAYWLKENDVSRPYLYIASEQFNDGSANYREVGRIAREMNDPDFDSFRVKLVPTNNYFNQELIELRRRIPSDRPLRYTDTYFGGRGIEWIYVYPLPAAVSA
ncbi:MAG TPA: hypothetical protein VH120_20090 [Gemmataceae bacterium]|nr:hypothetical protein [Gemmataceae bacterium]